MYNNQNSTILIDKRFKVLQKKGGQGKVFDSYDYKTSKNLAIKFIKKSDKKYYQKEVNILKKKINGIPQLISDGNYNQFYYIAMPLYGFYLQIRKQSQLIHSKIKIINFNIKNTILILVNAEDYFLVTYKQNSSSRYKPLQFCFRHIFLTQGKDQDKIYLIDFGISESEESIKSDKIQGNLDFMSINSHLGKINSYNDDLESLGYTLIFLIDKQLPWKEFRDSNQIRECKENYKKNVQQIPILKKFLDYVFNLDQDSKINYQYLLNTLNLEDYQINQLFDDSESETKSIELEELSEDKNYKTRYINDIKSTNSLIEFFKRSSIIQDVKRVFSENQII